MLISYFLEFAFRFECTVLDFPCHFTETVCEYPGRPRNGDTSGTFPARFRSVAMFSCNPGYQLDGSEAIVCRSDGTWSGATPQCTGAQS